MKHLSINIRDEMMRIKKNGNTMLECRDPIKAFKELIEAEREGKKFYSGCDNMTDEGLCAGHIN